VASGRAISRGRDSANIGRVTRPLLAVHGHFYQPERRNPYTGDIAPQPSAAPYRDWNARIDAECYKPNADRGNPRHISWDLGPTLGSWLEQYDPATHALWVAADHVPDADPAAGNAMAQSYHHAILPLASLADRRTEIRWGLRDFELRFGRKATGIWLPETAVDLPTLRILADENVRYTILAPWQAADTRIDMRRPYRVDLGGGRAIVVVFYDGGLSGSVSFESAATNDADTFARDRVSPRLAGPGFPDGAPYLSVIATDGELYGHHQKFRDLFLARLVNPGPDAPPRSFDVTTVGRFVAGRAMTDFPPTAIAERTSWSCHHGVLRWSAECPDAADGRWKAPLRGALERMAASLDTVASALASDFLDPPEFWKARDAYVDVVFGAQEAESFARHWVPLGTDAQRANLLVLLDAEHWRLAMFSSDGWYWDDPIRPETRQVMLCAARAVRTIDRAAGTTLESRLVEDLGSFTSPSRRISGAGIYAEALEDVGQPAP
jgi:hypothetical protein